MLPRNFFEIDFGFVGFQDCFIITQCYKIGVKMQKLVRNKDSRPIVDAEKIYSSLSTDFPEKYRKTSHSIIF